MQYFVVEQVDLAEATNTSRWTRFPLWPLKLIKFCCCCFVCGEHVDLAALANTSRWIHFALWPLKLINFCCFCFVYGEHVDVAAASNTSGWGHHPRPSPVLTYLVVPLSMSHIIIVSNSDHDRSEIVTNSNKLMMASTTIQYNIINSWKWTPKLLQKLGSINNRLMHLLLSSLIVQAMSNKLRQQCSKINISNLWIVHRTFDNWMRR